MPKRYLAYKLLALMITLCLNTAVVHAVENSDLFEMSIESLMNVEVVSASKFPQKKTDAPAAITVITEQDIKDYGYRTLSDVMQSIRGVYMSDDRNYSFVGSRGFNIPGDLNNRVLVLLDGYRLNDALYDQGPLGTEFPVDIDLIERVEYLPGAGSAIYGNNAFFGVINVITKSGKDFKGKGVEVSGRYASYNTDQERISFGKKFDNGLDMLLSATRYDSKGQSQLYFPEWDTADTHNGVTQNADFDKGERLFGKFSWENFTFESGYSKRIKGLPIGTYGTVFDDPRNQNTDQNVFFNLIYDKEIRDKLQLYARAYHGRYDYPSTLVFDNPPVTANQGLALARWWGTEVRFTSTQIEHHTLMLGGEFQDNAHLSSTSVEADPANADAVISFRHTTDRYGIYVQDEVALRNNLILNAGLRYDSLSYAGDAFNPRLALIYKPWDNAAFKLLYGASFRAPTANELYYNDSFYTANPNLTPEHIKTYEAIIEYQPVHSVRLTAMGFHYDIKNLIQLTSIDDVETGKSQFINVGSNKAWGAEFEAEKLWAYGSRLRASYTWANAYDVNNQNMINSPSSLAKLNFSTPLFEHLVRVGVDAQYTGSRQGRDNTRTAGYPMFNLSLTSGEKLFKGPLKGLEISGSLYNLLDREYSSVASDEFLQHFIPQNGRNFRVVVSYRF